MAEKVSEEVDEKPLIEDAEKAMEVYQRVEKELAVGQVSKAGGIPPNPPPAAKPHTISYVRNTSAVNTVASNRVETASFHSNSFRGRMVKDPESDKNVPSFMGKFETILGHVNQYVMFEELGRGMQGAVYKCMNQDDKKMYAIKCLEGASLKKRRRVGAASTNLKNEIEVMKKLDHPNLVKLYEVIDDAKEDRLYLVMDFVLGRSMMGDNDVMKAEDPLAIAIPESEAKPLFFDFVLGMEHLHLAGILHRDIKPSNMLIDNNTPDDVPRLKVCDFGVSTLCSNDKSAKILGEDDLIYVGNQGTIPMMPPEALGAGPDNIYHGRPADVWSAGVTLFCILFGTLPFKGDDLESLRHNICESPLVFPSKPKVSKEAKTLIKRMLVKDPSQRVTFSLMKEDPWFDSVRVKRYDSSESLGASSVLSSPGLRSIDTVSSDDQDIQSLRASSSSSSSKAKRKQSRHSSLKSPKDGGHWFNPLHLFERRGSRFSKKEEEAEEEILIGNISRVTHNQHVGFRDDGTLKSFGVNNIEAFKEHAMKSATQVGATISSSIEKVASAFAGLDVKDTSSIPPSSSTAATTQTVVSSTTESTTAKTIPEESTTRTSVTEAGCSEGSRSDK